MSFEKILGYSKKTKGDTLMPHTFLAGIFLNNILPRQFIEDSTIRSRDISTTISTDQRDTDATIPRTLYRSLIPLNPEYASILHFLRSDNYKVVCEARELQFLRCLS